VVDEVEEAQVEEDINEIHLEGEILEVVLEVEDDIEEIHLEVTLEMEIEEILVEDNKKDIKKFVISEKYIKCIYLINKYIKREL
jgi:hypothetical protein